MSKDIAVVKPYYLKEKAYNLGHSRFEDMDLPEGEDPEIHHFKESAKWANTVAPRLRAMAGFEDSKGGTYTKHRQVAAIKPGCEDDEPAEAELVDARHIYEELVDAWDMGARDGLEDTYDPESALV